jgi:hypothetical protein
MGYTFGRSLQPSGRWRGLDTRANVDEEGGAEQDGISVKVKRGLGAGGPTTLLFDLVEVADEGGDDVGVELGAAALGELIA